MLQEFDPVKLSIRENQFIIDHVGEPPVVAFQSVPEGVTRAAVKPIIDGVYELIELEKHESQGWVGVEAVKQASITYIKQAKAWAANKGRKGAPRFPSMSSFDSRGRAHLGGVGSDSGQVRTYFDAQGNRIPFAIHLQLNVDEVWVPEWLAKSPVASPSPDPTPVTHVGQPSDTTGVRALDPKLIINDELSRIECFCGHTEKFRVESRASYNAARARISKHLRKAIDQVDDHRLLHTLEFS